MNTTRKAKKKKPSKGKKRSAFDQYKFRQNLAKRLLYGALILILILLAVLVMLSD